MTRSLPTVLALLAALCLVACGDEGHPDEHGDGHGHDAQHEGPHGGVIVDVGEHEAHLEVIVDHDKRAVIAHFMTLENEPARLKDAPTLNLKFASGPKSIVGKPVDGTAAGASEWHFRDDALAGEPEGGRFKLTWNGKTYSPEFAHDHGHGHDDDGHDHDDDGHDHDEDGHDHHDGHDHGPHDGEVAELMDADGDHVGRVELKLHDDKGDLELWLTNAKGDKPFDVSMDASIQVAFVDRDGKTVDLAVRNREENEDEDGNPNLRGEKTNYFVFPGDSGADAAWLMGKTFEAKVKVVVKVGSTTWSAGPFTLKPHTHHGDEHDHEDHDED